MKRFLLVLLAVSAFASQGNVVAQDIHQPSTLILPISPATSYIIEPGKNVKISSSTAVVLTDGVHFKEGSTVRVFIGNTPVVVPAPNNPALNLDMNWTSTKSYDENGNIIGENKSFFDDKGVPLQSQVKSISTGHVLASQSLYDIHGRPVISTLAAPINNSGFSYKPDFVTNPAGGKYSYTNFDGIKTNSPDPLGQNAIGSLGWYYSNNNSFEAYVPATAYPYSRTAYYNDGTNSIKNGASIGDELRMGKGHETWGGSFPVLNELDVYSAIRAKYFAEAAIGDRNSLKSKSTQSFAVDQNGNIGVQISDLSGKVLMSARADDNGILSINNSTKINAVVSEYNFSVTTAGLIMGGSNPNAGGYGGEPSTFGIGSKYNVKVYRNGSLVYDGIGNDYVYGQLSLNSAQYIVKSSNPFTVSHSDGCNDCRAKIAESELSSIHYFQLFQATNVAITGSYELYDMKTESQISVGVLPKGYYKVRALEGDVNISYTNKVSDISFTFYNQLGQAIGNIAPEGVKLLLTNGLDAYPAWVNVPFAETNEYDVKGSVIASNTTDGGRTEFVYKQDGNVRFSQNAEQRKTGRFSYINYDRSNRAIESGEYNPGDISFASSKINLSLIETTAVDGGLTGGTKQSQVFTHYDIPNQSHGLAGYVQDEFFMKSAVSWTENANSKTWYNYDDQGRLVWLIKKVNGLGTKTIDYTYNGVGSVSTVDYQKNTPSERFVHHYEYDADSRLSTVYTSADGNNKLLQAQYYYYLHGPLKRVEIADNLQGIDYTYTIDGALKAINHPNSATDPGKDGIQNTFAADAFAMTLEYYNGDYVRNGSNINSVTPNTAKTWYNGNIAAQTWKSIKPGVVVGTYGTSVNDPKMFTYEYNDRYQFNSNKFGRPDFANNSFNEELNTNKEHGLSYDANGNIQSLVRNNSAGNQLSLNYHYQANTNKLIGVDNYANYNYDDLGQMTGQQRINGQGYFLSYNMIGKVEAIYADAAKSQLRVSFGYDESGMRISKTDHLQNITSYYVYDASGNVVAIYDNNGGGLTEKELPIYAANKIGNYIKQNNNYFYELTDHLGNVRVVLNRNKNTTGQADVVSYADYFPFGSPLTLANSDYRYGYQGQYAELDKETGWNNFDFRMYDAQIGRWMSTDPMGQYYSPYLAMGNNPIDHVDPDGGEDGTDPTYDSKKTLEVTVSAKRLNGYGRMGLRTGLGLDPYKYSNGKPDYEALYTKDTYAKVKWGKDPQWYLIEGAMYLQGAGEIAEGAYWGGKAIYAGGKYLAKRFAAKKVGTVVGEVAAEGGGGALVNMTEETFSQALFKGAENVGGYSVYGTKGLVGNTFNRNIFLLEASGGKSLSGFRSFVGGLESEALRAGANKISIYGSSVINKGFLNPNIAGRFGYSFEQSGGGVFLQKVLR